MPWDKPCKVRGHKFAKPRKFVFLLGGSIYDDNCLVRIVNRRRRTEEISRKNHDVRQQVLLWQRDFHALSEYFERNRATVWRSVPTSLRSSRQLAMESITAFFEHEANTVDEKIYIIYWCGHGEPGTGDWTFSEGGVITCQNLISAWRSRSIYGDKDTASLVIFSDTCHSGSWIDVQRMENVPRFSYQAACRANEIAWIVDDGNVPRSLLMRHFFVEEQETMERYVWTNVRQHPIHLCNYANSDDKENDDNHNNGEHRDLVHGCQFYFFTTFHENNNY